MNFHTIRCIMKRFTSVFYIPEHLAAGLSCVFYIPEPLPAGDAYTLDT